MVYILSAKRTPIGVFLKTYPQYSAVDLGTVALTSAIESAGIDASQIQDVIFGQVLTAGQGQNPARLTALKSGIDTSVSAMTINQVCGSGLRAVILGVQSIKDGLDCVAVGGQESMTNAHFSAHYDRKADTKDVSILKDTVQRDGLVCGVNNYHMGVTAENLAEKYAISRYEQDAFAIASQQKTKQAQSNGAFDNEIVETFSVSKDMFPRPNVTMEDLAELKTVFKKEGGTVTPGNASGINDGAVGIILASENFVQNNNVKPLAKIVSYGLGGTDPSIMGIAPVLAVNNALEKAGWTIDDLDLIESNEAFSTQSIAVNTVLGWNTDKVNIHGGAIALGHPIGASGARILTTLVHAMHRHDKKKGLATLCVGGGMAVAICIEVV